MASSINQMTQLPTNSVTINRSTRLLNEICYHYRETLQSLWSGYGEIARYVSDGGQSIIVKQVAPPITQQHPRGWNTELSHTRKLYSYQVEALFYRKYAPLCVDTCKVPQYLSADSAPNTAELLLEDLDAAGYNIRHSNGEDHIVRGCLTWLAHFHAQFLNVTAPELWAKGGYWHLDTRPDELHNMADSPLKEAAPQIDKQLHSSQYSTVIHGDAKLANFCFSVSNNKVAALDFQYVGQGPGIKDVMLLFASSFDNPQLEIHTASLLNHYFEQLQSALKVLKPDVDAMAVCASWRQLFPFAWADYQRFLAGWKPGHSRITAFMQAMTQDAMTTLG